MTSPCSLLAPEVDSQRSLGANLRSRDPAGRPILIALDKRPAGGSLP